MSIQYWMQHLMLLMMLVIGCKSFDFGHFVVDPDISHTYSTYAEAKAAVNIWKSKYGSGVSTKVIVFNDTPDTLKLIRCDSFSGRLRVDPPEEIGPRKYGAFLHSKRVGAAAGSIGFVTYENSLKELAYFGWYTPHSGSNYVGVLLTPEGHNPGNTYAMTYQTRRSILSKHYFGGGASAMMSIRGFAELKEDYASTLVYYKLMKKST